MKELYSALFNIQTTIENVKKDKTNPYHKSKYADINDVLEALKNPLKENKLLLLQPLISKEDKTYLQTTLYHLPSDQSLTYEVEVKAKLENDPQALGSAVTYFRRFSLVSLFSLEQIDDDANTASSKDIKKKPALLPTNFSPTSIRPSSSKDTSKAIISDAQKRRLYAIADGLEISMVKALLAQNGFESASLVTTDKYEKICEILSQSKKQLQNKESNPYT